MKAGRSGFPKQSLVIIFLLFGLAAAFADEGKKEDAHPYTRPHTYGVLDANGGAAFPSKIAVTLLGRFSERFSAGGSFGWGAGSSTSSGFMVQFDSYRAPGAGKNTFISIPVFAGFTIYDGTQEPNFGIQGNGRVYSLGSAIQVEAPMRFGGSAIAGLGTVIAVSPSSVPAVLARVGIGF